MAAIPAARVTPRSARSPGTTPAGSKWPGLYRTGDASHDDHKEGPTTGCGRCHTGESKFEATPIIAEDRLYPSTPLNRVIALEPTSGRAIMALRSPPQARSRTERRLRFTRRRVLARFRRGESWFLQ